MNNTILKFVLPILGVLLVGAVVFYNIKHPGLTPEQKLEQAQANLFKDSPRMNQLYESLMKDYTIVIKPGQLSNEEGRTTITSTESIVEIDVNKVAAKHDRLEPVLAHELFHIHDAKDVYGFNKFFEISQEDKNIPWWNKRLEISAFNQEDVLRKELIKTGHYSGMAPSRLLQNNRFK